MISFFRNLNRTNVTARCSMILGCIGVALAANVVVAPEVRAEKVEIGIIMEARPAEQPWSAAIFEAIEKLEAEDSSISHSQSYNAFDPTSAEPIARQLLADGHDILVLHSFALNDVAHALASEFPEVPMSVSSFDPPVEPNLTIATTSYLQIGYANCWLLARLSESGKVGFVGAAPIPYATELQLGCEMGAAAARGGTEVLVAYSNSFVDQQATREQAQGLVDQGADVLFPASATQDSLGGFQLCEQIGMPCAGWAGDARRFAPNTAVTSAIVDWTVMLKDFVNQVRSGSLSATTFDATYANGGLIAQPFEGPSSERVSEELQAEFGGIIDALTAGSVEFPASTAHPCCP